MVATTLPDVDVVGAFCMIDTDLPQLGMLSFRGYPLLHPEGAREPAQC